MPTTSNMGEYLELEHWKDFYCIEVYQYITDEHDRTVAIRNIEDARTKEDMKAIIDAARGLA